VIAFFLRRPIFASVCSTIIVLAGLVSIPTLPIAQFPKIAPPTVTVNATYTGASAQAVETSVTTPLEESINGVQGLRYITSQSSDNGNSTITCTFDLDRNLDIATTDVQNAVNEASARLPAEVTLAGVTVSKNAGDFVMGIGFSSRDPNTSALYLSNYADIYIKNNLKRIKGVSNVIIFGERKYAMRLWLDPKRLADNGLSVNDVTTALQNQNVQIAAGAIGQPPSPRHQPYQINLLASGRLTTPDQFNNMILKTTPDGGYVRLRDVGRTELGAEDYSTDLHFNGRSAVGFGIQALPSANALDVSRAVRAELTRLSANFPSGTYYDIAFDSTEFVSESIREVIITLLFAIALVVLTIFLFLQDWRTTLIPAITIPVSLIGTFALMKALGFSINTLTLFGLTLATGLVVDDAIVVIENIARYILDKGMEPMAGAAAAMREITGAVVATSLVLLAVFVPVAFFPGTTGQLYRQFALTIACSITLSLFNALTLTPTLSALLLRPHREADTGFLGRVNQVINGVRSWYHQLLPRLFRWRAAIMAAFALALGATYFLFTHTPTGFTPDEDQGYFIVPIQGPEGSSLDQTLAVTRKVEADLKKNPNVLDIFDVNGFGFTGSAPNVATMFVRLQPWADRPGVKNSVLYLLYITLPPNFVKYPGWQIFGFNPPSISGVGNVSGTQFELEDVGNVGLAKLADVSRQYVIQGNQSPLLSRVYTTFRNDAPHLAVDIDRDKAQQLGVPLSEVGNVLQVYLGSLYVNDFNYLNRSYRVYVQADADYRSRISDLQQLYVKTANNGQVPITNLISIHRELSAPIIYHYNLFRSVEINSSPGQGHGTGDDIAEMERLATTINPHGVTYEWSGLALDQIEGGSLSALIFVLGLVVVYLVLAAQYESLTDPFIILMSVPLALLGALIFMFGRNLIAILSGDYFGLITSDVYAQVGFVMLIGLASKNAILIVEFANQLREQGLSIPAAAQRAAETRFRPIIMTSIAFIVGIIPLVIAKGAGSASRHSLGTPVMGGMIVSTALNLVVVPVLYVIVEGWKDRRKNGKPQAPPAIAAEGAAQPATV
jgi:HAE1 family hydrophobic/amphiphilic exporter-1